MSVEIKFDPEFTVVIKSNSLTPLGEAKFDEEDVIWVTSKKSEEDDERKD